jgi:hypothetical protein
MFYSITLDCFMNSEIYCINSIIQRIKNKLWNRQKSYPCRLKIVYLSYLPDYLHHQLPVQSVPITTKVVSLNPVHGEVYSIQHYVIKFVSDWQQVCGFLRFPPPIKLTKLLTITIFLLSIIIFLIILVRISRGMKLPVC